MANKTSIYINLFDKDGNKLSSLGAKPTKQFASFIETKMKGLPEGGKFEFTCCAVCVDVEEQPEVLFNI